MKGQKWYLDILYLMSRTFLEIRLPPHIKFDLPFLVIHICTKFCLNMITKSSDKSAKKITQTRVGEASDPVYKTRSFYIIKWVALFTFYRFQSIKCARRQPSTFYIALKSVKKRFPYTFYWSFLVKCELFKDYEEVKSEYFWKKVEKWEDRSITCY